MTHTTTTSTSKKAARALKATTAQVAPPPRNREAQTFLEVFRAFAVLDLSGFTALVTRDGAAVAANLLIEFKNLLTTVASRRGVRVDKWLGDGALLVGTNLPSIVSTVVELEHWYESAVLPLRAGISSGASLLLDGTEYVSSALNTASRLCDQACAQHPVLLEKPQDLRPTDIPDWVLVSGEGQVQVKGVAEPINVLYLLPGKW